MIGILKIRRILFKQHKWKTYLPHRNVQVSVIGVAGDIGSNVALLLKQNRDITRLQLYDDYEKVKGLGMELDRIPNGPSVSTFSGVGNLGAAVCGSNIVVVTTGCARKPGCAREEMIAYNTLPILNVCKAMADCNHTAMLVISTNPLNIIIPFASVLLRRYNIYNPCRVFGVSQIDTARSRAVIANALDVDPRCLQVPVIGGRSDETIVPLFSNIKPESCTLHSRLVNPLTQAVRKAGTDVVNEKKGTGSATLAVAWAINEFVEGLVQAFYGEIVTLNSFTFNPNFGTTYFSGPNTVGYSGITQCCCDFSLTDYEVNLLNLAIPVLQREVTFGEAYVNYLENLKR